MNYKQLSEISKILNQRFKLQAWALYQENFILDGCFQYECQICQQVMQEKIVDCSAQKYPVLGSHALMHLETLNLSYFI